MHKLVQNNKWIKVNASLCIKNFLPVRGSVIRSIEMSAASSSGTEPTQQAFPLCDQEM